MLQPDNIHHHKMVMVNKSILDSVSLVSC